MFGDDTGAILSGIALVITALGAAIPATLAAVTARRNGIRGRRVEERVGALHARFDEELAELRASVGLLTNLSRLAVPFMDDYDKRHGMPPTADLPELGDE